MSTSNLTEADAGKFIRQQKERVTNDNLLFRAKLLPPETRALLVAHVEFGMDPVALAPLHNMPALVLRRKLQRLRENLCDPAFLLTAKFGHRLPEELRELATRYWVTSQTLREIALDTDQTLHCIRRNLQIARALLILEAKNHTKVNARDALRLLDGNRPVPQKS